MEQGKVTEVLRPGNNMNRHGPSGVGGVWEIRSMERMSGHEVREKSGR